MINHKVIVEFGKGNKATIQLGIGRPKNKKIVSVDFLMAPVQENLKIGDPPSVKTAEDYDFCLSLRFFEEKSINAVISTLQEIKEILIIRKSFHNE